MTKPVFDDEFKQGVVDYANQHPEESKVSIAKSFGIADSTIHKWIKDANKNATFFYRMLHFYLHIIYRTMEAFLNP